MTRKTKTITTVLAAATVCAIGMFVYSTRPSECERCCEAIEIGERFDYVKRRLEAQGFEMVNFGGGVPTGTGPFLPPMFGFHYARDQEWIMLEVRQEKISAKGLIKPTPIFEQVRYWVESRFTTPVAALPPTAAPMPGQFPQARQ